MEIVEVTTCLNELFPDCLNYFSIQVFNRLPDMFQADPGDTEIRVNYRHTLFCEHSEIVFALNPLVTAFLEYCAPKLAKIPTYSDFDGARRNELLVGAIGAVHNRLYKRLTALTFGVDIEFITALSGEMYENSVAANFQMAILPNKKSFCGVGFNQENCRELKIQNIHAVRKQLNLAKNGAIAVIPPSDGDKYCPCTIGFMNSSEASRFPRFRFVSHMMWEFHVPDTSKGTCRMRYWQGHLTLPENILEGEILRAVSEIFPTKRQSELVKDVIVQLLEQKKGAVAIFAEPRVMEKEVQRLVTGFQRGITPESVLPVAGRPKKLRKSGLLEQAENLKRITEIDGAVMIDTSGNCQAYGVILDGVCSPKSKGDMARGARLNSTKAYVEWRKSQSRDSWLGIVISEDGMFNLL